MKKEAPIIFIHYGDSNYLKYTLRSALRTNPNKDVILLGDDKNKKYKKIGVKHYSFKNYDTGSETELFKKVFKVVAGERQTKKDWINFSFKKWFYLYNFIKKKNIHKFWMLDSDTLFLASLSEQENKFSQYSCTEQCNGWCMKGLFNSQKIIKRYIDKINELFQRPDYLEEQRKDFINNPTFAFTEMRAYNTFKQEEGVNNLLLNTVINNETFDECVNQVHNKETEYNKRTGRIMKKLYFRNNKIYEKDLGSKKLARVNTLNTSWVGISFIQEIYLYTFYGKTLYELARIKNYIINFRWKIIPFIKNALEDTKNKFKKVDFPPLSTPVLFIIFSRPDTTQKVFDEIKKAQPKQLFVVSDGPRNEEEKKTVEETRKIIDQVDWSCEVKTNYSEKNLGCKVRVSSGIDWFFENVEQGIILEDDCLPSQSFFYFCQELLNKYKNDEQVMMISGDNFQFGKNKVPYDYYFSKKFFHIWGWATWKRAWDKYDVDMSDWEKFKESEVIKETSPNTKEYLSRKNGFNSTYKGLIDTWDYQWVFTCIKNKGFSVIPNENLISNIGFDERGTHTKNKSAMVSKIPREEIYTNIKHPNSKIENNNADNYTPFSTIGKKYRLTGKIKDKIKYHLTK